MSTTVSKILTYYLIQSYLLQNLLSLRHWCFPGKFMNFSEEATDVFYEKKFALFTVKLQTCNFIKKRLKHRCFPLNTAKILRTPILKNICWRLFLIFQNSSRTPATSCFCIDSFIKFRFIDRLLNTHRKILKKKSFEKYCSYDQVC